MKYHFFPLFFLTASVLIAGELAPPPMFAEKKTASARFNGVVTERGIRFGSKGVYFTDEGCLQFLSDGREIVRLHPGFGTQYAPWISGASKQILKTGIRREKNTVSYSFEIPVAKKADASPLYAKGIMTMELLPDQRLKFSMKIDGKGMRYTVLHWHFPFPPLRGAQYVYNGQKGTFSIPEINGRKDRIIGKEGFRSILIAPDRPGLQMEITAEKFRGTVKESAAPNAPDLLWMELFPEKPEDFHLFFDLRTGISSASASPENIRSGIDFWKNDRIRMSGTGVRNLLPNPSFESGLRFYTQSPSNSHSDSWRHPDVHSLQDKEARSGKHSLQMQALPGRWPASMNTFAIPVREGTVYTLSFYAKGSLPEGLSVIVDSTTGRWPQMQVIGSYRLSSEWKRYTGTFKALHSAMKLEFRASRESGLKDGTVWIDDLQLEKGEKATDLELPAVTAELKGSDPDLFWEPGCAPDLKLNLTGKPGLRGKIRLQLTDFYYRDLWKQELSFHLNAEGMQTLPLALRELPRGITVLKTEFLLADGTSIQDFFRLSVMNRLKNTHRHKDLFGTGLWLHIPGRERILARCRDVGFGSTTYLNSDEKTFEAARKYGIESSGNEIYSHTNGGSIEAGGKVLVRGLKTIKNVTPELERQVENAAYERARSKPWVKSWFFSCESELIFRDILPHNVKDFSRLQIATYKGVKKANPNLRVLIDGGPCNMIPSKGVRELESYLRAVNGEVVFDAVAIHPYRPSPEEPDMDADTVVLFEMLKKYGYGNKPVFWNEGIYYCPYSIPEYNLNPNDLYDHWRVGPLSYDMGWTERLSAAKYARSWLVALKYSDRIRQFNGWSFWFFMDTALTPFALQKIPNTLGRLLGNAEFRQDIRFAPGIRCYLFEDENQRPVAAIWGHDSAVDLGLEKAPVAEFTWKGEVPELLDLMENPRKINVRNGKSQIEISGYPLFLRGKKGSLKNLAETISGGIIPGREFCPVKLSIRPARKDRMELTVLNLLSSPFHGELKTPSGKFSLKLDGNGKTVFSLPLNQKISTGEIVSCEVPVLLKTSEGKTFSFHLSFRTHQIGTDIERTPDVVLSNKVKRIRQEKPVEFAAKYRLAYNAGHLYLRVDVVDRDFDFNELEIPVKRWNSDCVQLYIDTLADAAGKTQKGFDGNDYEYDFYPNGNGTVTVYRRYAAEQQQGGGLDAPRPGVLAPEVKAKWIKTPNGYRLEGSIPAASLAPAKLEKGHVAGIAVLVNNRNSGVLQDSLTSTPEGTEPYMAPHIYPQILFGE